MKINKAKRVSLVDQIVIQIEALIEKDIWPVNSRIPAESALLCFNKIN